MTVPDHAAVLSGVTALATPTLPTIENIAATIFATSPPRTLTHDLVPTAQNKSCVLAEIALSCNNCDNLPLLWPTQHSRTTHATHATSTATATSNALSTGTHPTSIIRDRTFIIVASSVLGMYAIFSLAALCFLVLSGRLDFRFGVSEVLTS